MQSITNISYIQLLTGGILLLIPLGVFWFYKTRLIKATLWATIRMVVQLLLIGIYLEYIFELNSKAINIIWVLLMSFISTYTIVKRTGLKTKLFLLPVLLATLLSIIFTITFLLWCIIGLDNIFDARYLIPITGMLMGNIIKDLIIFLEAYYKKIDNDQNYYRWHLANGATQSEALRPFMRHALTVTFNPIIATIAILGLISLPGMMTGQILGGSDPNLAVKYQVVLMISLFAASTLSVVLAVFFSKQLAFDHYGNLKKVIFR